MQTLFWILCSIYFIILGFFIHLVIQDYLLERRLGKCYGSMFASINREMRISRKLSEKQYENYQDKQ